MKTKILSLASLTFASSLSFGATSCLTGNKTIEASQTLTSRNYVVSPFTGVDCSSVVDIKIRQGSSQSVVLEAPTNYIDYFIVSVKNGILHVDSKSGVNFRNTNDIEMTIVVPELKMVKTSGTGDIDLIGSFQTGDFNAKTSGTGDIEAKQLRAASVNLESSGTGDISITSTSHLNLVYAETTGTGDITIVGSAARAVYRASGTGDVEASRMKAVNVEAAASGTGDIECYASEAFSGSASGVGDIEVNGNPATRTVETKRLKFRE